MRKKIVAGNWKMNKTSAETTAFLNDVKDKLNGCEVVFCVPSVNLAAAVSAVSGTGIEIGAQNMHFAESGAFTGEISASMLKDIGVKYVVIGHSERRTLFAETDLDVNKKTLKAIEAGLVPIVCVGETLEQREQGITMEVVALQSKIALQGVSASDAKKIVIAYEPVWAIGTGKTATSAQAEEVCAEIRKVIAGVYDASVADALRIQYGGSVNAKTAAELFSMQNIDGGLVGGASLTEEFVEIVSAAR